MPAGIFTAALLSRPSLVTFCCRTRLHLFGSAASTDAVAVAAAAAKVTSAAAASAAAVASPLAGVVQQLQAVSAAITAASAAAVCGLCSPCCAYCCSCRPPWGHSALLATSVTLVSSSASVTCFNGLAFCLIKRQAF